MTAGAAVAVMDLVAVLSPAGVGRSMLHALCRAGFPWQGQRSAGLSAEVADRVLGRLAGASLLTFNVAGTAASAHRLVMRVIAGAAGRPGVPRAGLPGGSRSPRRAGRVAPRCLA